jgi:hypothetical protein
VTMLKGGGRRLRGSGERSKRSGRGRLRRERYETFRQRLVKEAAEVGLRKREEVVADTTRRETKR